MTFLLLLVKNGRPRELVQQQREYADRALLNDIGLGNPRVARTYFLPLAEAEELVQPIEHQITALLAGEEVSL